MTLLVEFTIPAEAFTLGRALRQHTALHLELERIIPTGSAVFPYFWAWGADLDSFEAELLAEPAIEEVVRVDTLDDGTLFRAYWNDKITGLVQGIEHTDATLLAGAGTAEEWEFQLRFADEDNATQFRTYCQENDLPLEYTRIYRLAELPGGVTRAVTAAQRAALVTAYELGYFSQPRQTTLEEIAAELGITPQAVGGRLRRGITNMIAASFVPDTG